MNMKPEQPHGHHRLKEAVSTLGDVFAVTLTSFVGPHHRDHWEDVVDQYERDHPASGHAQAHTSGKEAPRAPGLPDNTGAAI
jgi:hypothetical protein